MAGIAFEELTVAEKIGFGLMGITTAVGATGGLIGQAEATPIKHEPSPFYGDPWPVHTPMKPRPSKQPKEPSKRPHQLMLGPPLRIRNYSLSFINPHND